MYIKTVIELFEYRKTMVGQCVWNVRRTGHPGHIIAESVDDVYDVWTTIAPGMLSLYMHFVLVLELLSRTVFVFGLTKVWTWWNTVEHYYCKQSVDSVILSFFTEHDDDVYPFKEQSLRVVFSI